MNVSLLVFLACTIVLASCEPNLFQFTVQDADHKVFFCFWMRYVYAFLNKK